MAEAGGELLSTVPMSSPSFLKPAGLHRIRFQEDLIEFDVHTTPGDQGAHVPFDYTEEGASPGKQAGGSELCAFERPRTTRQNVPDNCA